MSEILSFISVILILIGSIGLLIDYQWRWNIAFLALVYIALFWNVVGILPPGLAAVKLVAGWMATALLGASHPSEKLLSEIRSTSWYGFRIAAALLIWIVVLSIYPQITEWIPASEPIIVSGLALIMMGLLQLGMTVDPFHVVIGLLTTLAGFEVLYTPLEQSVLVTGLLAIGTLGLALVGAYLMGHALPNEETR